ncbi:uncharacterized protein LOC122048458 [Zingiber officinale]|uniref:uncharacterized protein LOC122048458 n=1 Tax=Zingiber officinale TaxID=94328 RepID=UPI001C4B5434|nr:uncharacterized protein LOC122048458 [Zingiber officinale]
MSKLLARSREVAVRPLEQTPHAIDYGRNRLHGYLVQPPRICSHDTASAPMRQRHNFMHTNYSVLYKKSFPLQTAPAGYVYPTCSASSGLEKNVFRNHAVSPPTLENRVPPTFTSDPLVHTSVSEAKLAATTRKLTYNDRKYSESSYHAADEDGTNKKYTRRETGKKISIHMLIGRMVLASRACMATMGILHYQLAQDSLDESRQEDELQ